MFILITKGWLKFDYLCIFTNFTAVKYFSNMWIGNIWKVVRILSKNAYCLVPSRCIEKSRCCVTVKILINNYNHHTSQLNYFRHDVAEWEFGFMSYSIRNYLYYLLTLNCLACQIRYVWLKFRF